jgi:Zn-dependent M16 (insulinase) family peptidase
MYLFTQNIGSGYTPATGYDSMTKVPSFSVGLQGIAQSDVERVTTLIEQTLQQSCVDGTEPIHAPAVFAADRLEAIIHQIEIGLKHVSTQFGIGMLSRVSLSWAHGLSDALAQLKVNR